MFFFFLSSTHSSSRLPQRGGGIWFSFFLDDLFL
jgi:hypothetical protein